MVDGDEAYEIYNKGCTSKYQINIEDVNDWVGNNHGVIAVEYPIGERRNFSVNGDILTIDKDTVADSKVEDTATDTEVFVWFETRQRVCQLSDLLGVVLELANTGEAGDTRTQVKSFKDADVASIGDIFTIENQRITHTLTAATTFDNQTTIGSGLYYYPALEFDTVAGDVVTFISTLNSEQERLVVELAAAYCALSIQANAIPKGGTGTYARYETKLGIVLNELETLRGRRKPITKRTWPKD